MELKENNVAASRSLTTKIKYIRIGFVRFAHALKGEVEVHLDIPEFLENFPKELCLVPRNSNFYLNSDKDLKTYLVKSTRPFKKGALVQLEGVENRDLAEKLVAQTIYFDTAKHTPDSSYLFWLLGFDVLRSRKKDFQNLGTLSHFQSHTHQDWMIVGEKKIEIPFVGDYIEKIDYEKKQIILNLPNQFPQVDEN